MKYSRAFAYCFALSAALSSVLTALPMPSILLCGPTAAHAAGPAVSKNVLHYARDMEFYYREQRPEVLAGILRSFDAQGVLAQGDKRLATAAFLAEVVRHNPSARERLFTSTNGAKGSASKNANDTANVSAKPSRNVARTLAWTAHLAGLPDAAALKDSLLKHEENALLRRQIDAAPTHLIDWNLNSEKTILEMYWGAYLASGETKYLDRIINASLEYARLNAAGLRRDPAFTPGAAAAASLYEFAPRHDIVRARVEAVLQGLSESSPGAQALRLILRR